jgi:predicted Zn finger-like uncharacterized protein
MAIAVTCPHCSSKLQVGESSLGKKGKCPKCQNPFVLQPPSDTPPAQSPKINVACVCGVSLKVAETLQGKQVRCPKCQQVIVVPTTKVAPSIPTAPAASSLAGGNMWDDLNLPSASAPPAFVPSNADAYTYKPSAADKPAAAGPKALPKSLAAESSASSENLSGSFFQFGFEPTWTNIRLVLFFGALLIVGPITTISGCNNQLTAARLAREGVTTAGSIVEAVESRRGKFGRSYMMQVAYQVEGKTYQNKFYVDWEFFYDHTQGIRGGDPNVEVMYAKSNPKQSQLVGNDPSFSSIGVGLSMFALGVGGLLYVFFLRSDG